MEFKYEGYYDSFTKYPHIYSCVYWGGFKIKSQKHFEEKQHIFQNRNKFIEEYGITKFIKNKIKWYGTLLDLDYKFDHSEIYLTINKGIVILFSPYCVKPYKEREFLSYGFKKVDNLYSDSATSYVISLKDKNELKALNRRMLMKELETNKTYKMAKSDRYKFKVWSSINLCKYDFIFYFGYNWKTIDEIIEKESAIIKIQRQARKSIYNPDYKLCRDIMLKHFSFSKEIKKLKI
jgi:hypothetical protein